jgi:hypothetical protein
MTISREQSGIDGILHEGELFELIMTTTNRDGTTNAAPVGVRRNGKLLEVALSESSHTLRNIESNDVGILNVVDDPRTFAQTAFDLYDQALFISAGSMTRCQNARATIEVELESREIFIKRDRLGSSRFVRIILNTGKVEVLRPPVPYSRSRAAAIEGVIAVTRAELAYKRGLLDIYGELKDRVLEIKEIAGGPDGPSKVAFEICEERLDSIVGGR